MSATHLQPANSSMPIKDISNITLVSPVAEGMAAIVASSGTSGSQVVGLEVEKGMGEQTEKHQDGMSHEYAGPMLTFSDRLPKPAVTRTNNAVTPAPESSSSAVHQSTLPPSQRSGQIYNPKELRSIFPAELPPRPAPKANFISHIFERNKQQSGDIEMGRRTSPYRQSPRYTLIPVKCHWSFLVGGWVFLLSCGAIVYWGVAEQFNTDGGVDKEVGGAVQAIAAMLKR